MKNFKKIVATFVSLVLILAMFVPVTTNAETNSEFDFKSALLNFTAEKGNDFTETAFLNYLRQFDSGAVINECFIKHAVDGLTIKGSYPSGVSNRDSEMVLAGNDGYVAVNATVKGQTFSGVAYIPHNEETLLGEVAYYQASAPGRFVVTNGVVTDYTGTATILIFANEQVSIDMSNATCKDKIKAVYFRTAWNLNLIISQNSFRAWSSLEAVMFQQSNIYVSGNIGQYAFAENPNLKYVRLMESFRGSNGSGYGIIDNYAFYNCLKLENCRAENLKFAGAQYGYGAFQGTSIRDYYLASSMQYNNSANEGNVFGSYPACDGKINVLTHSEATSNITATQMATLAQAASDKYSGGWTAESVKSTLVSSYSSYGDAIAEWSVFTADSSSANGILTIIKDDISVDVDFYRNNNEAVRFISAEKYLPASNFSPEKSIYSAEIPANLTSLAINYRLTYGATLVSFTGADKVGTDSNVTVILKAKDANGKEHTYELYITRGISEITLAMREDVSVRLDNPMGLRFTAVVSGANAVANDEKVKAIQLGMIIAPLDYLEGIEFTEEALASSGKDYLNIPQVYRAEESGDVYEMRAVISDLKEENYMREFAARAYADIFLKDGKIKRVYSNQNSDNIGDVADRILQQSAADYSEEEVALLRKFSIAAGKSTLPNIRKRLLEDKELTIGYIGGSITLGTSSGNTTYNNGTFSGNTGDYSRSWVNQTTAWFKAQYPDAEITGVNAGVSDTQTNLALFRLEETLMNTNGHDMPDLVFVEFTNNDWAVGVHQTASDLERQTESLFRNIYALNPNAQIIVLVTARSGDTTHYNTIADYYNIPVIDVGVKLAELMTARGHTKETAGNYYYTIDDLHPSIYGYDVYSLEIQKYLSWQLDGLPVPAEYVNYENNMPSPKMGLLIDQPEILLPENLEFTSGTLLDAPYSLPMFGTETTLSNVTLSSKMLHLTEDTSVTFRIEGEALGILLQMHSGSDVWIDYVIDGKDTHMMWGSEIKYTYRITDSSLAFQRYEHPMSFMLEHSLGSGTHTVTLNFKIPEGQVVDIGGILYNAESNR